MSEQSLTPAQIAKFVVNIESRRLHAWVHHGSDDDAKHLPKGIALNVVERNQVLAIARLALALSEENERLKAWQLDVENREATVCPEDVGFDEHIAALAAECEKLCGELLNAERFIEEKQERNIQ